MDGVHDRHLDTELVGERLGALAGGHAFGHHLHAGKHLLDGFATPDVFTHIAVAAVLREAGHDKVAHAGEARKRFGLCTESLAQSAHFGLATGKEGSTRVVANLVLAARLEPVEHARGNCNHVLHGTAEFHAHDVGRTVNAQVRAAHHLLHELRGFLVHAGGHNRGKNMAAHFFGMRRPAEGDHLVVSKPRHVREQHFAHQLVRAFENALGSADNDGLLALRRSPLAQVLRNTAHKLARHHDKHHVTAVEGCIHVSRILEIRREDYAGELVLVLMFRRKQIDFGLRVCPERNFALIFIDHLTESQAPTTST